MSGIVVGDNVQSGESVVENDNVMGSVAISVVGAMAGAHCISLFTFFLPIFTHSWTNF